MKNIKILVTIITILSLISPQAFGQLEESITQSSDPNKISLDFKGMDIIDVLKLLAQRGNMNISISKTVRGRVTIFLKEVDVQDAFEIILTSNGLAYDERNGIIHVMTEKDYERRYGTTFDDMKEVKIFQLKYAKAGPVSKAISHLKTKIGKIVADEASGTIVMIDAPSALKLAEQMINKMDKPTQTRIFGLDYATAEDVKAQIEERLTENIGHVQTDERTNKIIVTDLYEKMAEIERVVSELDEKTLQVLIEAKILEITLNDEFKMGINWDYVFSQAGNVATGFNFSNLSTILPAASAGVTGSAFEIGNLTAHDYHVLIQALKTVGDTDLLSAPRVVVVNNEEASILVGSSRPYATTGTTVHENVSETTQEVQYVDLGVKLNVTPTINRDGYITMKIKPEISSSSENITVTKTTAVSGSDPIQDTTNIPIISTSTAETTVMLKDGNTVVIAGLIEERQTFEEKSVPFLSDIPIIGNLFKSTTHGSSTDPEKKEVVIFLTPHIISGGAESPEVKEDLTTTKIGKSEYIREPEKKEKPSKLTMFDGSEEVKTLPKRTPETEVRRVPREPRVTAEEYSSLVRSRVYEKAREYYPRSKARGNVYVAFDVLPNGTIKGSPRILGHADEALEILAVKSVYEAAPFPPFPSTLRKPQETFKVLISYQ